MAAWRCAAATTLAIPISRYRQGGCVPSEHTTTVFESCGTTTTVVESGFGGLPQATQPNMIVAKTGRLDVSFIFHFLAAT